MAIKFHLHSSSLARLFRLASEESFPLHKYSSAPRDTIDAVGQIARMLHISNNIFTFAGTKDR